MKGNYLITTDNWFFAPDGRQYKAIWGNVELVSDSILGIKTNRISTNWFAKVGSEANHVIIAGCQIHYAIRCESKPNTDLTSDYSVVESQVKFYNRPTSIYVAE